MSPDIHSRAKTLKARPVAVRAKHAANDSGQATCVAVVLIAVTNANSLRRALGFDRWGGAFLSFVSNAKALSGGARISQFSWDTMCLVFDAITPDELERYFKLLSTIDNAAAISAAETQHFETIAGAAFGDNEIDALERAEYALSDAKLRKLSLLVRRERPPLSRAQVDLAGDLALAIPREELFLVYQPKVHLRQRAVSSAEALIRWQHPVLGLVMPDAFINLADETGEMRAITLWTLRQVIIDQQRLAKRGHALRLFINISGGLLTDRVFIDAACALVTDSGAEIGFEITETAVIRDPDLAIENLEHCAAIGITLAIDDYGSGLSSLSYLKRLPATELKIDKMFITQLTSSHRDPLIVRSTIDLAHALDMEVTAEGVETPAALALLTVMGCEMVQGYLISAPIELPLFINYLNEYQFEALQTSVEPTVHRPASFWQRA
jgi:diguanylate cyclase